MIIGIDPGMSGAICFLDKEGYAPIILDTPTLNLSGKGKTRRRININQIDSWFCDYVQVPMDCHAFIEKAQSMPGQGVASMFGYGVSYGMMLGLLTAWQIKFTEVTPQSWKKTMLEGMDKSSKDASRAKAMQLWPHAQQMFCRKNDQHIAEAALIAEYGRRILSGNNH